MWDLPGSGTEPVSPALAGGFSTTAPPGKPKSSYNLKVRKPRPKAVKWLAQDVTAESWLSKGRVMLLSAPRAGCVTLGRAEEQLELINWQTHQVYHNGLSYLCQEHDFSVLTQELDGVTGMCRVELNIILLSVRTVVCQTGITQKAENFVNSNQTTAAKVFTKKLKLV